MKFSITSKGDETSNALAQKIRTYLLDFEFQYDEDQPDIVISVGETEHCFMHFIDIINDWIKQRL